jgi:serine/threonine protein kinase
MAIQEQSEAAWLLSEIGRDEAFAQKYRIERELGSGAFGIVVCAHHRELDENVSIKFLRPGKSNEASARFLQEARAANRIRNQHVVRILDASTSVTGIPYIVMEYLEGVDLERMLLQSPNRQLPIPDAIEFVLQACEALAECHHRWGIIHRDLKPSNLFCVHGADGLPMIKVLDFGISKLSSATFGAGTTESSDMRVQILGSPPYMSPEQFESSTNVDARTDIWSIGVVLYEFVTGRLPFSGNSLFELREAILRAEPAPVRESRRDAPAGLTPVLLKCLEKDRKDRYANVAELAKALWAVASVRSRDSITRIVRTIEAPGIDTQSLALPRAEASLTPIAESVRLLPRNARRSKWMPALFAGIIAGSLTVVIWSWNDASRPASSVATPNLPAALRSVAPPIPAERGSSVTVTALPPAVAPSSSASVAASAASKSRTASLPRSTPIASVGPSSPEKSSPDPAPGASAAPGEVAGEAAPTASAAPSASAAAPPVAAPKNGGPNWLIDVISRRKRSQ